MMLILSALVWADEPSPWVVEEAPPTLPTVLYADVIDIDGERDPVLSAELANLLEARDYTVLACAETMEARAAIRQQEVATGVVSLTSSSTADNRALHALVHGADCLAGAQAGVEYAQVIVGLRWDELRKERSASLNIVRYTLTDAGLEFARTRKASPQAMAKLEGRESVTSTSKGENDIPPIAWSQLLSDVLDRRGSDEAKSPVIVHQISPEHPKVGQPVDLRYDASWHPTGQPFNLTITVYKDANIWREDEGEDSDHERVAPSEVVQTGRHHWRFVPNEQGYYEADVAWDGGHEWRHFYVRPEIVPAYEYGASVGVLAPDGVLYLRPETAVNIPFGSDGFALVVGPNLAFDVVDVNWGAVTAGGHLGYLFAFRSAALGFGAEFGARIPLADGDVVRGLGHLYVESQLGGARWLERMSWHSGKERRIVGAPRTELAVPIRLGVYLWNADGAVIWVPSLSIDLSFYRGSPL